MGTNEFKPGKGWLGGKVIPRKANGDPAFEELGRLVNDYDVLEGGAEPIYTENSVLAQFTPEQVVYIVNKWLYSQDYQRETHRKRAAAEQELMAPVKRKVKELYGVPWLKATEEQIVEAVKAVKADKEREEAVDVQS